MRRFQLYGRPGWGSVLIEAQLAWYGIEYDFIEVGDLFVEDVAQRKLEKVNPAAQVPALEFPDGSVMTESAAITLWLSEEQGSGDLVPEPRSPQRAQFLRWLMFIAANIYPAYTYMDVPARFVPEEGAQEGFAKAVCDRAKGLYTILDGEASSPWFLGDRFSVLDIYICTMTRWLPRRPWFEEHTPKLVAIADATENINQTADVWARNFPKK